MDRTFTVSYTHYIKYDIKRVSDILNINNPILAEHVKAPQAFCLIDSALEDYLSDISRYFKAYKIEIHLFLLNPSEEKKNLNSVLDFTSFCFIHKISRRDPVISFGGGIICDLAGLAANLIRRGTPCIKIPTTLLGIIDASVGVKTGVNYLGSKNSLGTYSPPEAVLLDLFFLKSLPEKEIKNGLVEMIKILSLRDRAAWVRFKQNLLYFLESDINAEVTELIDQSVIFMTEELRCNLFEKNLKRIVDFGHEFGHLIEIISSYKLSHGQAVGIGMLISNIISKNKSLMNISDFEDFMAVYASLKFPYWDSSLTAELLYAQFDTISRHKGGEFSIVALEEIGRPIFINSISLSEIKEAADTLIKMQVQSLADQEVR